MKRRLRKKLRRGEFTAYGCSCRLRFHKDSQALRDELLTDLTVFAEARGGGIFGGFSVNDSNY